MVYGVSLSTTGYQPTSGLPGCPGIMSATPRTQTYPSSESDPRPHRVAPVDCPGDSSGDPQRGRHFGLDPEVCEDVVRARAWTSPERCFGTGRGCISDATVTCVYSIYLMNMAHPCTNYCSSPMDGLSLGPEVLVVLSGEDRTDLGWRPCWDSD